jgi:hypothetical protein
MIYFSSGKMKHYLDLVECILYVYSTNGRKIGRDLTRTVKQRNERHINNLRNDENDSSTEYDSSSNMK